ncbi:TetR/AcrR family transcriptional regulator [Vibrio splendidus]|jgi:AcrR family transcriptional regulator|uniref:TetR/AcrR family transcriptional regulator n=1 Tax=Vibrio sp. SBT000027 TaxID=1803384 RepID=UPI0009BE0CEF|nr:hypothetical protein BK411_00905 [Vibrio splendidus]
MTTNGFQRRAEQKKDQIISTAKTLFFSKGPASTSIAELAKEAKVSQVSIYNYFGSKEALVELVVTQYLNQSFESVEAILELESSFQDKLKQFFALGDGEGNEVNKNALKHFDWQGGALMKIYERFVQERQIPFLLALVKQGQHEGEVAVHLQPEAIVDFMNANMTIYKDPDFLKKGHQYMESVGHLFFYGILGKK